VVVVVVAAIVEVGMGSAELRERIGSAVGGGTAEDAGERVVSSGVTAGGGRALARSASSRAAFASRPWRAAIPDAGCVGWGYSLQECKKLVVGRSVTHKRHFTAPHIRREEWVSCQAWFG